MKIATRSKSEDICFILYGSRHHGNMKSFGPKQLYRNYFQESLIFIQLRSILETYPQAEIVLVVGQDADRIIRIKDKRFRIIENQLFSTTNEVEDIRLALNNTFCERVVLASCDLYMNKYTIQNLLYPCLIGDTRNQLNTYEIGINIQSDQVLRLDFKLDTKWCNITYLQDESLKIFRSICNRVNQKLYLFEVINQLIDRDIKLKYLENPNMRIFKVDTPENYRKFQTCPTYK